MAGASDLIAACGRCWRVVATGWVPATLHGANIERQGTPEPSIPRLCDVGVATTCKGMVSHRTSLCGKWLNISGALKRLI